MFRSQEVTSQKGQFQPPNFSTNKTEVISNDLPMLLEGFPNTEIIKSVKIKRVSGTKKFDFQNFDSIL